MSLVIVNAAGNTLVSPASAKALTAARLTEPVLATSDPAALREHLNGLLLEWA